MGKRRAVLWFPRRLVWLGLAFLAMTIILSILEGMAPAAAGRPAGAEIAPRLPVTGRLLGLATGLGIFFAAVIVLVGVLVFWLRRQVLPLGAALQRLGQTGVALGIAIPLFVLAVYLLDSLVIKARLFPLGGAAPPAGGAPGLKGIFLPALALSILPACLVARSVLGEIACYWGAPAGLLSLHVLLRFFRDGLIQAIGMLGGVLIVETVFMLPGVGALLVQATMMRDYGLLFDLARSFLLWSVLLRALADGLQGVDGFIQLESRAAPPSVEPSRPRWLAWGWLAFCLLLIAIPLAQGVGGLLQGTEAVVRQNITEFNLPPGSESATGAVYRWGTDMLGRDIYHRARYAQGALILSSLLVMLIVLIPAMIGGGLAGSLAGRETWWADLLDDLVLFPAEALSALPGLVLLVVILSVVGPDSNPLPWLALAFLLPRGVRLARGWWLDARLEGIAWRRLAAMALGLLVLGTGWAIITQANLGFLGVGVQPPRPDLGAMVREGLQRLPTAPYLALRPGWALVGAALGWFLLADTLFSRFGVLRREGWLELNR